MSLARVLKSLLVVDDSGDKDSRKSRADGVEDGEGDSSEVEVVGSGDEDSEESSSEADSDEEERSG